MNPGRSVLLTVMMLSFAALSSSCVGPEPAATLTVTVSPTPASTVSPTKTVPGPDGAKKATEAARPTPTPIPGATTCPVDAATCEFGEAMAAALHRGAPDTVLAVGRPTTVDCPEPPVGHRPLCEAGGRQTGYSTGNPKAFGFVGADEFRRFVSASGSRPEDAPRLLAVGCPQGANGQVDCGGFASFTIGAEGVNAYPLVLLADRDPDGSFHIVGARRVTPDEPPVRGGSDTLGQRTLPYQGLMRFMPVSLK